MQVSREAVASVEQDGIVFIDEIDKIVSSREDRYGATSPSDGFDKRNTDPSTLWKF